MANPLKIGTGNSKTGPSWSLPNIVTCPGRTKLCESLCYASTGMMAFHQGEGNAYDRKYRACIELLKTDGGSVALGRAIAAQIRKQKLKTLRIHDSGDFFSPLYVRAWRVAVANCPDVRFWFYTRSWRVSGDILAQLRKLAAADNVAGWISADNDCYLHALSEAKVPVWAGIAFMQTDQEDSTPALLQSAVGACRYINFATHSPRKSETIHPTAEVRQCPVIQGKIALDAKNPACIKCGLCLPTMTSPGSGRPERKQEPAIV